MDIASKQPFERTYALGDCIDYHIALPDGEGVMSALYDE